MEKDTPYGRIKETTVGGFCTVCTNRDSSFIPWKVLGYSLKNYFSSL